MMGRGHYSALRVAAPQVSPQAWIAPTSSPTATLGGDVRVEAEASVWYGPCWHPPG
jgi:carbonic anhydrase/acetyltransferase-like protein (isoleucine patch superfamily)